MNSTDEIKVFNNEKASRFEVKLADTFAFVDYRSRDGVSELHYIYVPPPFRGRGIAEELIKYVLDDAAANNRRIIAYCSWIAGFIKSHPEYHALLH